MYPVKQSTSLAFMFWAGDTSGAAVTGKVDGDWTKRISKNGAAFAAMTITVTEAENGWYSATLSSSHTDTNGILSLTFKATGVVQVNLQFRVQTTLLDDGVAVASIAANAITASAVATGAITAAKFAAGAIDAAAIADGAIDAGAIASNAITAAAIATGAITSAKFAAGAIDAAAIATDAIDADALKADAVTEITSGIATSTQVAAVTTAISALLPAALVGGKIDAHVNDIAASAITAASIADDAITAAKIADGAIDAATFAAGAINAAAIAADAITAAKVAADVTTEITSGIATSTQVAAVTTAISALLPAALVDGRIDASVGAMAANTLTATAIAADAITAAKVAADVTTELQSGLATAANQTTLATAVAAVQTDVDDLQTRLPAALVSGRIDASVGAMAANTLTASALATDAVTEVQTGLATSTAVAAVQTDIDDVQARLPAALVGGKIDASIGALGAGSITSTTFASGAITSTTFATGAITAAALAADAGIEIATAVLAAVTEGSRTVKGVLRRLDALVSGKATGLLGSVFALYAADGTTKLVEATQNLVTGARTAASTVAGD